ncbi:putative dolichyl-P-Man:GDP-Man1GlcNAc2-PP-dolichyl alpha-1,3-mannosyltransferase [Trypanosoma rangeli]|uniref:GDP-Man:Man(3)GlcNAc(2)-PP-Dol alpha-1,2-mannosyltransferase n=1 Tax=Trypanosoma rangeli TaxID=5698 RepID=A0A3R7K7Z3_TRYRA|nr:putative dolichyl-P-Man:GDP-Man1GlcNAc2-PP-dolichyl alpha-1,3-mannosyltransferase [Trypanosoma rangeli]RNF03236.1 putative dolichyl-P-Man:GDP-Man1GlcNAc2-PP-dolichyl alpha-1,3-mannosyltransferase [Trypanosoma rangeli]|eukprot:RNF03236.1 putative dolichyl-P-Man:GDP-Man1GlcNAc2-PP-dolichyl alpha-1,3-mannosyltransferase [Trypanosoma rangeli]
MVLVVALIFFILLLFTLAAAAGVTARYGGRRFPRGTVGFLHPSAASGGGGERVLWVAMRAIQLDDMNRGIKRRYVLYCSRGAGTSDDDDANGANRLLQTVQEQFQILLPKPIEVAFLRPSLTRWLNGEQYPFMTLLLQVVCGSLLLFYETCIVNSITPIVIESVGIPGIYPLLSLLAGAHIISYTHYPVITSIMAQRVQSGEKRYNNRGFWARHHTLRLMKVVYYKLFALFYWWLGQFPYLTMTNSQWTTRHIEQLWNPVVPTLVYPPCAVKQFLSLRKPPEKRGNTIVSVGQFRPEKNHLLQLRAFARALPHLPADARLIMVGGARSADDRKRAADVEKEAKSRGISDRVEVRIGVPFAEVGELLSNCCIGLHTMEDEHFGIVVVEYMACGCIPLAHNSGGVCLDIIMSSEVGFLAASEEEFASRMVEIVDMKVQRPHKYKRFQDEGLTAIMRFSDETFQENFMTAVRPHLLL